MIKSDGKCNSSKLAKTFDASADVIFLIDSNRKILHANQAIFELTGREVEKLIDRNCCEVVRGRKEAFM